MYGFSCDSTSLISINILLSEMFVSELSMYMIITFVDQSSSTLEIKSDTSDSSGRYTSRSPFTFKAGTPGSLSKDVSSSIPLCVTKNTVKPRNSNTVNNGNFVIAPIAPVLCHSFFIFPGASSTASIAVLELKLLIFSEMESFLALRL